jgi:hypothetical protein
MNCERSRAMMAEAAAEAISARRRVELDGHLGSCASCRAEFERVRALLNAIDQSVVARAGLQDEPEVVGRLRQRIAEEAERSAAKVTEASNGFRSWWATAAACAAVAVLGLAVWVILPQKNSPQPITSVKQPAAITQVEIKPSSPGAIPSIAETPHPPRNSGGLHAGRIDAGRPRRMGNGAAMPAIPNVIVQPGQMQAILQLEAAIQSGKVDGTQLKLAGNGVNQPIDIKPLTITPLDSAAMRNDEGSKPSGDSTNENFVSAEPERGKTR